jgi:hypothetical protein
MFDWLSKGDNDAIAMLKKDHETVKKLFDQFEEAQNRQTKKKIVNETVTELKVHGAGRRYLLSRRSQAHRNRYHE